MKKALAYVAYALAGLAVLLAAAGVVTQTGWFRERLRGYVVRAANERLVARLDIDRVDGNLFRHIELDGVRLVQEGDTLVSVSSIEIDLVPRRLFAREIRVDSCIIGVPRAALRRRPDGSWNFSNIVKPSPADTGARKKFPFAIRLDRVALRDGALSIDSKEPAIPRELTGIRMTFSAYWGDTAQALRLTELGFQSESPPIVLEQLTFAVTRTSEGLAVSDLSVRTSRNALKGRGFYSASEGTASDGSLETEPVDLSGLKTVFPALRMHASPAIVFDASLSRDTLSARIGLTEGRESVVIHASVFGLSRIFDAATRDRVEYSLRCVAGALDVAHWSGSTKIDFLANGVVELHGKGVNPATAAVRGSFDLGNSTVRAITLKDLTGTFSYASGDLSGTVVASGRFGRLAGEASVTAVTGERRFEARVETGDLDLSSVTGRDSLRSRLNLAVTGHGTDLGRRAMAASIELRMSASAIYGIDIDTVSAGVEYMPDHVLVRRLHGRTAAGTLEVSGDVRRAGPGSLSFVLGLEDLSALRGVIPADTLRGWGRIEGVVAGRPDSVSATGRFSLAGIAYDALCADSAGGDFSVLRGRSGFSGSGSVTLSGVGALGDSIASISAALGFAGGGLDLATDIVYRDSIRAHAEARVTLGEMPVIAVRAIRLDLPGRIWSGGGPETAIRIEGDRYRIEGFSITAPGGGESRERRLSIDGTFSREGEEDLRIEVSGLDIAALMRTLRAPISAEGSLSAEAELTGTAREPRLEGTIEMADVLAPPFNFKSISADFEYRERRFTMDGFVEAVKGPRLTFEGFVPLSLSFDESGSTLFKNEPWGLTVKGDAVPVGSFSTSSTLISSVKGVIDLDLRVSNTLAEPEFAGTCSVREGAFVVPSAGIDCKRFALGLAFDKRTVTLDTLRADIGAGFIAASGSAAFNKNAGPERLAGMRFDLTASNLYLESRKKFEILFSGRLTVEGTEKESSIGGAFTIEKSRLFLPSLAVRGGAGGGEAPPLLVAALKQAGPDSAQTPPKPKRESALKRFGEIGFVNRMEGSVRISMPSGTMLRSPEMSIEIGGDLDVVKSESRLELFGPIQIIRGQYTLFGKRFQTSEGTLTFKGGEKINPDISVSADCVFRTTDGDKKTVTAIVSGEARSPSVRFTLDGRDITETDAVSYITTGRSMDEMAQSGGATTSEGGSSGAELAASAAAGMLAGQLSYALGGSTSLDVLDIDTQNSWQNATVTVGKYLSPKLFVSYEAGIGQFDQDEIDPNAVRLEYRFSRLLYLHLVAGDSENSGLGFTLKYER